MIQATTKEQHYAKRKWGQNFLVDPNIAGKILDCAEIRPGERVIEIGPGQGILTQGLLERGAKVTAIEIDRDLIKILQTRFQDPSASRIDPHALTLVHGDALAFAYENVTAPYKVVANLPYNISSPLLFRLLEENKRIDRMILMLQKEVAERIVSVPGVKAYGALSVMVQYYADVSILFRVSPTCFRPRPKIASAVISLKPLAKPRVAVGDEALFKRIVKGAFQHRRKQLPNALRCAGFDEEKGLAALLQMKIDPKRRGETLSLQDFAQLSDTLHALLPPEAGRA